MRCCLLALLAALSGCQDKSREAPPAPPAVLGDVKVVDPQGTVLAELKQIRPCRVTIGPQEMIVGGPPIQSTVGTTTWTGNDDVNGTTFTRDGERIARLFPLADPHGGAVFDLHGAAQVRIKVTGQVASVENKSGAMIRKLTLADGTITASDPALTITGTDDLVLAGLLSASELLPEIRMLAACERVLVKKGGQ